MLQNNDFQGKEANTGRIGHMKEISPRVFKLYALSLPKGLDFGPELPVSSWLSDNGVACGLVQFDEQSVKYSFFVMRRRQDDKWQLVEKQDGIESHSAAVSLLETAMRVEEPKESIPSGVRKHKTFYDLEDREPCDLYKMLYLPTHEAAGWALHQIYLALPNPDKNFVSDFQTKNFHTRLWELYLYACFKEQGLEVKQDHDSPDYQIIREADSVWVEVVTANPEIPYEHVNAKPVFAPEDSMERQMGAVAFRYAKTLRSKLQKNYHLKDHVKHQPFAMAIADFHAPGSMVWSREALPCYLYGTVGQVVEKDGKQVPQELTIEKLLVDEDIPAGLFRGGEYRHVSAVIHSNAATISKFNRMGFLAGYRNPGIKMTRLCHFFNPSPDAIKGDMVEYDIASEEYENLWPNGENWSLALEIYHNPYAKYPLPRNVFPMATHWFEEDGDIVFRTPYKNCLLSSVTHLQETDEK